MVSEGLIYSQRVKMKNFHILVSIEIKTEREALGATAIIVIISNRQYRKYLKVKLIK